MRDVPWKAIDQPVYRKMHQAQKIKSLVKKGTDKGRLCINGDTEQFDMPALLKRSSCLCATQLSCYLLWLPLKWGNRKVFLAGKSKVGGACCSGFICPSCLPSVSHACLLLLWDAGGRGASSHRLKGQWTALSHSSLQKAVNLWNCKV